MSGHTAMHSARQGHASVVLIAALLAYALAALLARQLQTWQASVKSGSWSDRGWGIRLVLIKMMYQADRCRYAIPVTAAIAMFRTRLFRVATYYTCTAAHCYMATRMSRWTHQ